MKEDIQRVVLESVENIGKKINLSDLPVEVEVGIPKRKEFGDFSINTAMILAKKMGENPRKVAELIIANLPPESERLFKKVDIAGAGFINFFVRENAIVDKLAEVERLGESYGRSNLGGGKKILLEFVSANPTGFLHIGHARNAVVGDVVSNILSASGYDVTKEFYINDAGRQMDLLGESVYARYRELFGIDAGIPEDGYKGDYVKEIAAAIMAEKGDALLPSGKFAESAAYCREYAEKTLLDSIRADLTEAGIRFDEWYSERKEIHGLSSSSGRKRLDEIKERLREKGALEEREGALWFAATRYGDSQDWVMIKSDGSPTYFLADIAYHADKYERGYDRIINVWGADHHGHVSRLRAALRALGYDDSAFSVILIQFVRLMRNGVEVPMSKRSGSYVTMREVIAEVGPDVMRFFLLMRSSESHLDFDLELAQKESSENPVFYIQYAYARIASIFRKADVEGLSASNEALGLLTEPDGIELIKKLLLYPEVVSDSAETLAPHKVAYFLQELAADFHSYYNKHRVVDDDKALSGARLYLIKSVRTVLSNGLGLLGISAPDRM
jgi:arginyl-tRNA synthetase